MRDTPIPNRFSQRRSIDLEDIRSFKVESTEREERFLITSYPHLHCYTNRYSGPPRNYVKMPSVITTPPRSLGVGIVGSRLDRLSAAIAIRRQEHRVVVYERYDFANEVGASLSVASNGSRFLEQWEVDIPAVKPWLSRN